LVRLFLSLLFLLFASKGGAATDVEVRLELSKPQFFDGEPIVASYVVEAPQEKVIEIEVVKFPEFRGFWSENTLLRQGPVHLSRLLKKNGKASAVIGAYNLNSMMGFSAPSIEPIKVLIREQNQSSQISPDRKEFSPTPHPPLPGQLKK
jgi:hypothetical protein